VLCEEEHTGIELHKDVALGSGRELEDQHGILVPKASEEATIEEEGWHAIQPSFSDVGEREQESPRVRDAGPPGGLLRGTGST
jgi:hypothetical protein